MLSAIIDNGQLTFAVLSMDPDMSPGQCQVVTLTAGRGDRRSPLQGFWIPGQARNNAQTGLLGPSALALIGQRVDCDTSRNYDTAAVFLATRIV